MADLGFRCESVSGTAEALASSSDAIAASLLIPPLPDQEVDVACRALRESAPRRPLFVVFRGRPDPRSYATLRDCGAAAVFSWPADDLILLNTLVRVVLDRSDEAVTDVALEERVRFHLDRYLAKPPGTRVQVTVKERVVVLQGKVAWPRLRQRALRLVHELPDVRAIDSGALTVEGASPDAATRSPLSRRPVLSFHRPTSRAPGASDGRRRPH